MQIKMFDESHEKDLEMAVNSFLSEGHEIMDIKYNVAITSCLEEQIYCFTAMIIYRKVSDYIEKK